MSVNGQSIRIGLDFEFCLLQLHRPRAENGYERGWEVEVVHGFTLLDVTVSALVTWKESDEASFVPFKQVKARSPLPLLVHYEKKFKPLNPPQRES